MFLNTANLKHHLAAAQRGRYALNAIALTSRGTLSTDGHALLFVPYPEVEAKDVPKIDGVDAASPPPALPFLLAIPEALKAAAMVGKAKRHASPFVTLIQAEIKGDTLTLGATDLSNAQVMRVPRLEGEFPEVGGVIPDYATAMAVSVDLENLLQGLKALRGASDTGEVTLRVIDDQHAIGLSCKNGAAMLLMPIQVEKPEEHVPDQLAKLREGGTAVAAPAPEEPEEEEPEDWEPTETEMAEAYEAFTALPPVPAGV